MHLRRARPDPLFYKRLHNWEIKEPDMPSVPLEAHNFRKQNTIRALIPHIQTFPHKGTTSRGKGDKKPTAQSCVNK
ncbi:unnamed protein product [Didymodactylos carnosus]|uniref:Uncharacterized protein n=1 Tax=Didymodactylos carnosus TaxID=1234261 RepID=A0A8S2F224_9BILA|nr:unnamed protein product [Didymodactylos carnosus]CAF4183962.1 unnamed protein product [Didymodactylos carnosus]